jgi:hypothetical protein
MAPLTIYPSRFIGVFTLKLALSMLELSRNLGDDRGSGG